MLYPPHALSWVQTVESDKDNRTKTLCPFTSQAVEVYDSSFNEDYIHITRDGPDVTFDIDPNTDDGEVDV